MLCALSLASIVLAPIAAAAALLGLVRALGGGFDESAIKIARKFAITVRELREANGLMSSQRIRPPHAILVPMGEVTSAQNLGDANDMSALLEGAELAEARKAKCPVLVAKLDETVAGVELGTNQFPGTGRAPFCPRSQSGSRRLIAG